MKKDTANELYNLIIKYDDYKENSFVCETLQKGWHKQFKWNEGQECIGGFLIKNANNEKIWILFVDWRNENNYYIIVYTEKSRGPNLELHKIINDDGYNTLVWKYRPSKGDRRNEERKEYFVRYYNSTEVCISTPLVIEDVEEFFEELVLLHEIRLKSDSFDENIPLVREGFPEGKQREKIHKTRERNSFLISDIKNERLEKHGKLDCECCGFNFEEMYGVVGQGFIEAHHTIPISELPVHGGETKKDDIALVCSNCHRMIHRMIHRIRPWLSLTDIRQKIKH